MSLKALEDAWSSQLPLLTDRVRARWFDHLGGIQDAISEDIVHQGGLLAKGFIVALFEAELITESGAQLLGTTLRSIQDDALARLLRPKDSVLH